MNERKSPILSNIYVSSLVLLGSFALGSGSHIYNTFSEKIVDKQKIELNEGLENVIYQTNRENLLSPLDIHMNLTNEFAPMRPIVKDNGGNCNADEVYAIAVVRNAGSGKVNFELTDQIKDQYAELCKQSKFYKGETK